MFLWLHDSQPCIQSEGDYAWLIECCSQTGLSQVKGTGNFTEFAASVNVELDAKDDPTSSAETAPAQIAVPARISQVWCLAQKEVVCNKTASVCNSKKNVDCVAITAPGRVMEETIKNDILQYKLVEQGRITIDSFTDAEKAECSKLDDPCLFVAETR